MPVSGGTTLKLSKARLAPAQEGVALAVALELALGVVHEREAGRELVDLHRVVDHQLDRLQRVDPGRVAAEVAHRVAHRREVDDRRHAGEVLEQHARRARRRSRGWARRSRPRSRAPRCPRPRPSAPSSFRSRFSSRTLSANGSRATSYFSCSASSRKISYERSPTVSVERASKLLPEALMVSLYRDCERQTQTTSAQLCPTAD